jgi:hypothetical protein
LGEASDPIGFPTSPLAVLLNPSAFYICTFGGTSRL